MINKIVFDWYIHFSKAREIRKIVNRTQTHDIIFSTSVVLTTELPGCISNCNQKHFKHKKTSPHPILLEYPRDEAEKSLFSILANILTHKYKRIQIKMEQFLTFQLCISKILRLAREALQRRQNKPFQPATLPNNHKMTSPQTQLLAEDEHR